MADTPLGKGLIEIGANLAPLEVGLTTAQARVQEYLTAISAGLDPSKPRNFANAMKAGESSLRESATQAALIAANIERSTNAVRAFQAAAKKQAQDTASAAQAAAAPLALPAGGADRVKDQTQTIKQQTQAINQAAEATSNLNRATSSSGAKTLSVGQSLQQTTKGFREFAGAITGTIGAVTGVIGVFTLLTAGIRNLMQKQEEQKRAQLEQRRAIELTRKELQDLNRVMGEGAEGILYTPTQLDRDIEAINKFYDTVKEKQGDLYRKEVDQIQKSTTDKTERNKKIDDLNAKSLIETEDREARRIANIEKVTQDALKREAANRAQILYENELRAAQAAGEERKVIDLKAAEEKRRLSEQIAGMEAGYDRDLLTQRLQVIEAERLAEHKKINEREQAEKDAAKKIADERRQAEERAAKAFAEAQRAAFGQLQSQINNLFNTGNMEVGINRVAGLIQVLIDKTERG